MISFADISCNTIVHVDEETKYNAINMSQFGFDKLTVMDDPYFAIQFWWDRKNGFPEPLKPQYEYMLHPSRHAQVDEGSLP